MSRPFCAVMRNLVQHAPTHSRLSYFLSLNTKGELGDLDAQAGLMSQQQQVARAPLATVGGEDIGGAFAIGSNEAVTAAVSNAATAVLDASPDAITDAGSDATDSVTGGDVPIPAAATPVATAPARGFPSSVSASSKKGSMTDVAAHEVVVGCLVRLALVARGETASEVMSVLERERGRARARERLGREAVGPMEEVVAKVGSVLSCSVLSFVVPYYSVLYCSPHLPLPQPVLALNEFKSNFDLTPSAINLYMIHPPVLFHHL